MDIIESPKLKKNKKVINNEKINDDIKVNIGVVLIRD